MAVFDLCVQLAVNEWRHLLLAWRQGEVGEVSYLGSLGQPAHVNRTRPLLHTGYTVRVNNAAACMRSQASRA